MLIPAIIFWLVLGAILYAYAGYPLLLAIAARVRERLVIKAEIEPFVTILITAYNEEKSIRDKLTRTLQLDYPKDKLEIIVASDGSTDATDSIVREFADQGVRLVRVEGRAGKTAAQNQAVRQARGEIILFSDATTLYEPGLIRKIVRSFADPAVGAVGGELVFVNRNKASVGEGENFYWRYEKFLKKLESRVTSLIGLSGCCYAVRKELYRPLSPDIISDFVIAQVIYQSGKRVVYEPEALACEETNDTERDEFDMRVRVAVRTLYSLWRMRSLLNPIHYGFFSIQLISHKVMRYLVPTLMVALFLVNAYCAAAIGTVYSVAFALQAVFYLLAGIGGLFRLRLKLFYIPFYVCLTHYALLTASVRFMRGEKRVLWQPLRK